MNPEGGDMMVRWDVEREFALRLVRDIPADADWEDHELAKLLVDIL
jgi:hypothetical protein